MAKSLSVFQPLADKILPKYSQNMWWLANEHGEVTQVRPDGHFEFNSANTLNLHWGHPAGAILNRWQLTRQTPLKLDWDGIVRLGGFIERTHIFEDDELGLMVAELVGGAYPENYQELPSLADLQMKPFSRNETDTDVSNQRHWYSLLVSLDSPFADFLNQCLVNGNAIDCQCSLGDDEGGWHELVGLPLIVERLTLLSTQLYRLG